MNLLKKRYVLTVLVFFSMTQLDLRSQSHGVVADKQTRLPIAYANIYSQKDNNTLGTISNEKGYFSVEFPFQTIFFSHINYEKSEVLKANLKDTVFLTPNTVLLSEIVVKNKDPRWINRILHEVAKQKVKNYQTNQKQFAYSYESSTLTDSTGYAFASNGILQVPVKTDKGKYFVDARHNVIKYKDKTAGVDFTNLKTMLYVDFISYFDRKFIRNNLFTQNDLYKTSDRHMVQIMFHEKNQDGSKGYMIVDTLNKVIVETEHNMDTEYNLKNNTTLFFKVFAPRLGMKYNLWATMNHAIYSKWGDGYYLSESTYKFCKQESVKNKKREAHSFTSSESKLHIQNQGATQNPKLIPLLKPYYLITIMTKQMQKEENELNKVPVQFEKF